MRILSAHNFYLIPGGEDKSRDTDKRMLCQYGHTVDDYLEDNRSIQDIGFLNTAMRTIWSIPTYRKAKETLKKSRYDIVHCENTFPLISPSIYYAACSERIPVIQSLRNYRLMCLNAYFFRNNSVCESCHKTIAPFPGIFHKCYKDSLFASSTVATMLAFNKLIGTYQKRVSAFIALTEFARDKFIEAGLPSSKIFVKPNYLFPDPGVDSESRTSFLYAGRLSDEKGISILLQAWKLLGSKPLLQIAGTGPLRNEISKSILGIPNIQFVGLKSTAEIYTLLAKSIALVLPSQWYEGFPRIIIEAFAKGTPVIASDLGAMSSIISHGQTGLHFEYNSPESLAMQVERLLLSPSEGTIIGTNARNEFENKYTSAKNYKILMDIYSSVLSQEK